MMTVQEALLAPDRRPLVLADCEQLVDREVAELSGVTGTAARLAYKTVRSFDAGHIPAMIESILPSVADVLAPYWESFSASSTAGGAPDHGAPDHGAPDHGAPDHGDFGEYLAAREDEVAEALLAITDSRQRASSRATIVKAYKTVRGGAVKHVKAALPALGTLVQKHMSLPTKSVGKFAYFPLVARFRMIRRGRVATL